MIFKTLFIALSVFILDQFTKWYVVWHLNLKNVFAIDVFPPFLNFRMGWNQGVNFGLFSNNNDIMRWVLTLLALVISISLLIWLNKYRSTLAAIFVGLIIGGAIGNAFDRIIHGAVVDFLNMSCCHINNPYTFNLADVWIFIGAFGILIIGERFPKKT